MVHPGFAHVRDPEGLVLEVTVTIGDPHALGQQVGVEVGDIHPAEVPDGGDGLGAVAFRRQGFHTVFQRPGLHPFSHGGMPGETRFQPFSEDLVEFDVQRPKQGNGRGHGGGVLDAVLFPQQEVKVPAAVLNGLRFLERTVGDGREGNAGGQGQTLLRGGQDEIQSPGVGFDLCAAEGGNGIHQDQGVRADLMNDSRQFL